MTTNVVRQNLVPSQIKGGFIDILKDTQRLFPRSDQSTRVTVYFDSDTAHPSQLNLGGWKHNTPMVTGLKNWFQRNNAQPGDLIEIAKLPNERFRLSFVKNRSLPETTNEHSASEAPQQTRKDPPPMFGDLPSVKSDHFVVMVSETKLEAWNENRLPFEPKGWLLSFRGQLRDALQSLRSNGPCKLYAAYSSPSGDSVDVENVLFYNVGPSYFSHLDCNTLLFERSFSVPPSPGDSRSSNVTFKHHHFYSLESPAPKYWKVKDILAEFNCEVISHSTNYRLEDFWYSVLKGSVKIATSPKSFSGDLGIHVRLFTQLRSALKLVPLMKPLLDGVISAFHVEADHNIDEKMINVIAGRVHEDPKTIREILCINKNALLGERSLVHKWRDSVQWNPADDSLVSVKLSLEYSDIQSPRIAGELFSVDAMHRCEHPSKSAYSGINPSSRSVLG